MTNEDSVKKPSKNPKNVSSRSIKSAASDDLDAERKSILSALSSLVKPLNRSLIGPTEVVLHDLGNLPNSIVAIAGDLTNRKVGSPASDIILQNWSNNCLETAVSYETKLPDGRNLRSTTIIIPASTGEPVAALCINCDVSIWKEVAKVASIVLPGGVWPSRQTGEKDQLDEIFPKDVNELGAHLIDQAIKVQQVPIDLMQKRHKKAVVAELKAKGFFTLKESVDKIAATLNVTRFTIYNYLNELNENTNSIEEL